MARRTARSVSESIIKLSGNPRLLGTIDFTATSKTNHQATTPFNNTGNALLGKVLVLSATQNCYILPVTTNVGTVTTATGVPLFANERVIMVMDDIDLSVAAGEFYGWLACIRSTADGNLRIWELV